MAFGQICLSGNRNTKHSVTKQGHSTLLKGPCATAEVPLEVLSCNVMEQPVDRGGTSLAHQCVGGKIKAVWDFFYILF